MDRVTFRPFPKIPRFRSEIIITEKIDGTNAAVLVHPDGSVTAGSRNQEITVEKDNYGFAKWVSENQVQLVELGTGIHYGEWWGPGIQRRYGIAEKRFSLFYHKGQVPKCCHLVPTLYQGETEDIQARVFECLQRLQSEGSVASPGFMRPEGVIIYHVRSGQVFKRHIEGEK